VPFSDIRGQDQVIELLKSSIRGNKVSHAYIFAGPEGVGKSRTALNFAKALICANSAAFEACDTCAACKKIEANSHPDVSVLKPEKEGAAIKIDAIRTAARDIYLKPFEAKKKVYIIEEAQDMKHEAANALLKTLEEPPTDSVLILITNDLSALFQTIVSRSQVVRFYPLKSDLIKQILMKDYAVDGAQAHILSRLASGSLSKALAYRHGDMFRKRSYILNQVCAASPARGISFEDVPKEEAPMCLEVLLSWYRDVLAAKAGADESMLVNIDKKDAISKEAAASSHAFLEDAIQAVVSTNGYLDNSANYKLAMNVLALKLNNSPTTSDERRATHKSIAR
jgi:DNA polymerase-3 subunit delta'